MTKKNDSPTAVDLRNFAAIMAAILAGLFGVLPLLRHRHTHVWAWVVAAVFLTLGLFAPMRLRLFYLGWMRFGKWLGNINSRIVLTVVYVVVFFPVSLVGKLLRKDALGRHYDASRKSYRVSRSDESRMDLPY